MNAWVDRIKIISDAVMGRAEYLRLEKEIQAYQRIAQSWRLLDVSEEEKTRLTTQLTSLENQFDIKKKDLNALTHRLIDSEFWPALPKNAAAGVRGSVEDLQGKVKDIYDTIEKLQTLRLSSSISGSASPPKDVTPTPDADRPAKRRRLENGDATLAVPSAETREQVQDPASSRELDSLKDRVLFLEDKLSEMQNELVQYDSNMLLSLQDEMETKFEQYGLVSGSSLPVPVTAPAQPLAPTISQPQDAGKVDMLETGLGKAGEEIGVLAHEVGALITRNDARDQDMVLLHDENEYLKIQILDLQNIQSQNMKALEVQKTEIEALKAAVTLFVSQTKPEPRPMPTIDEIVASCQPQLVHAMRQEIQPLLEDMKGAVETMLQTQSTELCNVVLTKLATTLQTVQSIASWMDTMKQGGRSANSVNGVTPQKLADKLPAG